MGGKGLVCAYLVCVCNYKSSILADRHRLSVPQAIRPSIFGVVYATATAGVLQPPISCGNRPMAPTTHT